jgi:tetratricopeptide (TPR) repeat protein
MDATFSADEHFRRGCAELDATHHAEALAHFRAAQKLDPASARVRSYYGLCLGLAERRFDKALELCRSAAKAEFFNPLLYHNLALVHLAFGFKSEALRYLRRGLMIDPECGAITRELERLGQRKRPTLAFLRRQHPLNRWLGRARDRFVGLPAEPITSRV